MDQKDQKLFKVVLIGASQTGKTCLSQNLAKGIKSSQIPYKTTVGVDFIHATESETNTKLQLWDTAGQERFNALSNQYFRGANLILIVVDPQSIKDGTHALKNQIERVTEHAPPEAKILYVVTQWDKADALGVTKNDCEEAITQAPGYKEEKGNILYYSSETATDTERETFLSKLISMVPQEADETALIDDHPVPLKTPRVKKGDMLEEPKSYFTGPRLFGFLVLFAALGTTFLALGGVTGGVEHIWANIGEFFSAIQLAVDLGPGALLTDWGIGVLVASIGLAFVITAGSMAIDYYRKAGNEPGSETPDQRKGGYSEISEGETELKDVTKLHKGPLAGPQVELTDGPEAPAQNNKAQNKGWCTIL